MEAAFRKLAAGHCTDEGQRGSSNSISMLSQGICAKLPQSRSETSSLVSCSGISAAREDQAQGSGSLQPIRKEAVPNVPGAFLIRNCLTAEECKMLASQVKNMHEKWREEQRAKAIASHVPNVDDSTLNTHSSAATKSSAKGMALSSKLDDLESKAKARPRRMSQHHLPCRMAQTAILPLSQRIRTFLPQTAGPENFGKLLPPGREISSFLRCYHYHEGEMSTPHYDKSFTKHFHPQKGELPEDFRHLNVQHLHPGQLLSFTAYSVLLYLNENFEGGETTFFHHDPDIRISRRGLAPHPEDLDKLKPVSRVAPKRGDILVFPHGKFKGCHPDPLHEGSLVRHGEKLIIRTDLVFEPGPRKKNGRKPYKGRGKRNDTVDRHVECSSPKKQKV